MRIIDTHCHYNLDPLSENWQDHWETAQEHSVTHSIVVGTTAESSQMALTLAAAQSHLYASVGYHPNYIQEHLPADANLDSELAKVAATLAKYCAQKPLAIGETGLDFYRLKSKGTKRESIQAAQHELLKLHLSAAQKHSLPVILHVRDQDGRSEHTAYDQILTVLKQYQDLRFVLHCASGPLEYIQEALALGGYIGFDGNTTYDSAHHLRSILAHTPADRILLETDAPFLAPEPYRGGICEPWMIEETAKYFQETLKVDMEQVFQNSISFFGISDNRIQ